MLGQYGFYALTSMISVAITMSVWGAPPPGSSTNLGSVPDRSTLQQGAPPPSGTSLDGASSEAVANYSAILRRDPRNRPALEGRAVAFVSLKRYAEAEKDARAAIALEPDGYAANPNANLAYLASIAASPSTIRPHEILSLSLCRTGRWTQALAAANETVRLFPSNPAGYASVASILATSPDKSIRNGPRALEFARAATARHNWPDKPSGDEMSALAAAHAECGDFGTAAETQIKAIEQFKRELRDIPPSFRAYLREEILDAEKRLNGYQSRQPYRDLRR